ncbi:MAG: glycosyltransferase family 39 protein [Chloroflexota bacterium]|nr:glycosyltransferase family 39 protein [Chloroflexota bacterium]
MDTTTDISTRHTRPTAGAGWWLAFAVPLVFAGITFLVHLISNLFFRYGYFRDEFYYLVCGDHLAFGYVDHPPLIAVIARGTRTLLGDSIVAIRLPSAIASAGLVFLTGLMAWELGGRRFAQALACLCAVIAPVYLIGGNMLSTIPFDQFWWTLCAFFAVRLVVTDDPRHWLAIGATVGIGFETKHNMIFLICGIVAGVLLTSNRRHLRSRWLWIGAAIAAAIALPNILWEIVNGWPTLEFVRNAAGSKNAHVSPVGFLANQILSLHPLTMPIWLTGLVVCFRTPRYRLLGCLYLVPMLIFMATQSARPDYLAPAYPVLFAVGAVAIARWAERRQWRWAMPATLAPLAISGVLLMPLGLPILPPAKMAAYSARLTGAGVNDPSQEQGKTAQLPQYFADQFGWPELTAAVARVYDALPPADQAKATIFTGNYGEAGALAFFGGPYHLPPIISGHNNYYLWGPGNATGDVVIVVGYTDPAEIARSFMTVEPAGATHCTYCMDYENNVPIFIARGPKQPIRAIWSSVKHYT